MGWCPECERDHKRTVGVALCPRCYMAEYRQTDRGRLATRQANRKWQSDWWQSLAPDERNAYSHDRLARTFQLVPEDVHELREAVKRLELALAGSEQRLGGLREQAVAAAYEREGVRRPGE